MTNSLDLEHLRTLIAIAECGGFSKAAAVRHISQPALSQHVRLLDIVAEHDLFGGGSRDLTNGRNHFSAMPSLHTGWSALCAYTAWLAARRTHPRLALLAWLFPAGMVAVVITTGNHYVLDVVGSALLLTTSIIAATVWDRWRTSRGATQPEPASVEHQGK